MFQETVFLGDIPIAALWPAAGSGITVIYVHTDHLNTPRAITRPSDNAVLWRWESDPFGTTLANEDPDGDSTPLRYYPRFPGQFYDASSELHYNYFRDYDPLTGRFLAADPYATAPGSTQGWNRYSYVENDPATYTDPSGWDSEEIVVRGRRVRDCSGSVLSSLCNNVNLPPDFYLQINGYLDHPNVVDRGGADRRRHRDHSLHCRVARESHEARHCAVEALRADAVRHGGGVHSVQ